MRPVVRKVQQPERLFNFATDPEKRREAPCKLRARVPRVDTRLLWVREPAPEHAVRQCFSEHQRRPCRHGMQRAVLLRSGTRESVLRATDVPLQTRLKRSVCPCTSAVSPSGLSDRTRGHTTGTGGVATRASSSETALVSFCERAIVSTICVSVGGSAPASPSSASAGAICPSPRFPNGLFQTGTLACACGTLPSSLSSSSLECAIRDSCVDNQKAEHGGGPARWQGYLLSCKWTVWLIPDCPPGEPWCSAARRTAGPQ